MLKEACRGILASELLAKHLRRQLLSDRTVVLMYHELAGDDSDIESWSVLTRSAFLRQVEYLRSWFDVVPLEEALACRPGSSRGRPRAVLTFDDGNQGNADILLPLATAYELPVTIFVATQHIVEQRGYWFDRVVNALQSPDPINVDLTQIGLDRYQINLTRGAVNWQVMQRLLQDLKRLDPDSREKVADELVDSLRRRSRRPNSEVVPLNRLGLRALAASPYITIGAHSHCHSILTQLDGSAAAESVTKSKSLLEEWTQREVWAFAYPNGDYDEQTVAIVRGAGFRCAMATGDRLWTSADSPYAIPRMGVGRYDSLSGFKLNLLGGPRQALAGLAGSRQEVEDGARKT